MTDPIPELPPEAAKLRAQDLALLEEDARRFLVRDRPASDALMLALQKPRDRILREYAHTLARQRSIVLDEAEGRTDPFGRELGGPAALVAIAEAVVAQAILGDLGAAKIVFNRIEGVPAHRKGDLDEAQLQRAETLRDIEDIVRHMNHRPGDGARDITHEANGHAKPNGSGSPQG